MKKFITVTLLIIYSTVFSQSKQDTSWKSRLIKVENLLQNFNNKNIENEISTINDKLDFQQKMYEQTNSSISNQLESASYNLTIFGLLFGIGAILLGFYVTYIERKIVKIGEENKELLTKNQKIKDDVESLNKLIQSDIYNLFLKIKREESVHIIDRLVKVPKDISNVCDTLISRELQQEDFQKIKQAYLNLPNKHEGNYGHYYKIVFSQHFLSQALRDEELREDISKFIPDAIRASFENDITKSTIEFVSVILDKGIQEYKSEINLFFYGLTNSQFKSFMEVYQLFFDNLKTRKNQFEIFNAIESTKDKRLAKIEFGKILLNKYSNDNQSESESLSYNELKELINQQQKEEEEELKKAEEQKKKKEEQKKKVEEHKAKLLKKEKVAKKT
ncbi:MAG: hypothetical protein J0L87_12780 [Bacteroidetes bacterium]|nr:hypothetical protein [Bacteroidota bacterium]